MTRKDFELIARAIRESKSMNADRSNDYSDGIRTQHHVTALQMASALESTNPRFNRERFLKACGIEE